MKTVFNAARLVLAISRGAVEWLYNPQSHRHFLRARSGKSYAVRPTAIGNIQLIEL